MIHAYEPNSELEDCLNQNCASVGANYFLEAIARQDSLASLRKGQNSLHSTIAIEPGTITCTAYSKAIQRLGNGVDLVKLDCEGAEWELFKDIEVWSQVKYLTMEYHLWADPEVKYLTMEYHLWADPGYSFEDLLDCLKKIEFICVYHKPSPSGKWGLIQAVNKKNDSQNIHKNLTQ